MAIPLSALERRLTILSARLTLRTAQLLESIGTAVGEDLVIATPVLTGFARANWRPALNAPPATAVSFLDPTGTATIAKIIAVSKRARAGDTIW